MGLPPCLAAAKQRDGKSVKTCPAPFAKRCFSYHVGEIAFSTSSIPSRERGARDRHECGGCGGRGSDGAVDRRAVSVSDAWRADERRQIPVEPARLAVVQLR